MSQQIRTTGSTTILKYKLLAILREYHQEEIYGKLEGLDSLPVATLYALCTGIPVASISKNATAFLHEIKTSGRLL